MAICAARNDVKTAVHNRLCERLSIFNNTLCVTTEFRLKRLSESNSLRSDDMHKRTALKSRKDCRVDLLRQFLIIGENNTAAGSAKRLMRRRCHDMGMLNLADYNGEPTGSERFLQEWVEETNSRYVDSGELIWTTPGAIRAAYPPRD